VHGVGWREKNETLLAWRRHGGEGVRVRAGSSLVAKAVRTAMKTWGMKNSLNIDG